MAGLSMLRVVSNSEMMRAEEEQARKELQERQRQPLLVGMAGYLRRCWDAARSAKSIIEYEMLDALRARNGEYDPGRRTALTCQGGSTLYCLITETKCRAAESWLRDILMDTGAPPWDIEPTPIPDLGPIEAREVQDVLAARITQRIEETGLNPDPLAVREMRELALQEYRQAVLVASTYRCARMKLKIEDQFAEGGWPRAFDAFITDIVTFPTAFLKGPVIRRAKTLGWEVAQTPEGPRTVARPVEKLIPMFDRVDPFRLYPEPGIGALSEGYLFEHHKLSRPDLADLIGVPGYDENAIRLLLDIGNGTSWISPSYELSKEQQERKYQAYTTPTDHYDALEFWGRVNGHMLREWGLSDQEVPDPAVEYDANVWLCGDMVLKAVLNTDPLGRKPYYATSFAKQPGALWGRAIPRIIADIQDVCNAAGRALVNNMGLAAGPQVEVNIERLPPGEDITQLVPWRIWQTLNDPAGSGQPAVRFTQPDSRAGELLTVYEKFSKMADDQSGIPSYIYGDLNVTGAGRTSSGLSMLMGAAGKAIRQVVSHIDGDIIKPVVEAEYTFNMRYDPDESIKGDARVVAKGAINLAVKETVNVRRLEFLNATGNEIDMGIIGPEGRASILREVAKGLQMPTGEIVPSPEKLALQQAKQAAAQQAQPTSPGVAPQPSPQTLDAAGQPAGGMNTVAAAA